MWTTSRRRSPPSRLPSVPPSGRRARSSTKSAGLRPRRRSRRRSRSSRPSSTFTPWGLEASELEALARGGHCDVASAHPAEETSRPMSTPTLTQTVPAAFRTTAADHAKGPALQTADGAMSWTWGEYARLVRDCTAGLAGLGLRHGDTLACWLSNRPEFHVVDLAAAHLGAASFSVHPTYTAAQAGHVIGDAGSRILVTESQFLERALA